MNFLLAISSWWWIKFLEASLLSKIGLVLASIIPTFFFLFSIVFVLTSILALVEILLFNLQKLFGFKFPLIGDFLMRRDKESKERIARDDKSLNTGHKQNLGFVFSKRELTTNELHTAQSVFETKDMGELRVHLASADINLDSNVREKLEKKYEARNGGSFY